MAAVPAQIRAQAKPLLQLSLENGVVSAERVAGVLEYLEKNPPASPQTVLAAYRKLVTAELAKGEARGAPPRPGAPPAHPPQPPAHRHPERPPPAPPAPVVGQLAALSGAA